MHDPRHRQDLVDHSERRTAATPLDGTARVGQETLPLIGGRSLAV
ncbi:hypothetical protein ACQB60_40950 [Actinomycetota bacterium Odt1-20B]